MSTKTRRATKVTPPRLMSRTELADHLDRFHGFHGAPTLWQHNNLHHVTRSNHAHRSAFLSEVTHRDWQGQ